MSLALKIACRTIRRRLLSGEAWADVLMDYPRLTYSQKQEIKEQLGIKEETEITV